MKLNNSDELIFKKASVLSKLDLYCQKAEAYKTYPNRKAWLDALLEARQKCDEVYLDAKELGITEEVDLYARNIEKELNDEFGITPEVVEEICNNSGLKSLLEYITGEGRIDTYFGAFREISALEKQ